MGWERRKMFRKGAFAQSLVQKLEKVEENEEEEVGDVEVVFACCCDLCRHFSVVFRRVVAICGSFPTSF